MITPNPEPIARWNQISRDPNSQQAIQFRNKRLDAARAAPVPDRAAYLAELARGKRVLDVGVVDHFIGNTSNPQWLHGAVSATASYCLGVDILPEAIEELRKAGHNVRVCDITKDPIEGSFDIIICGEVIEHLGNPGGLFEAASRLLVPGGRLVLTTPNPYYLSRLRDGFRGQCFDSVDHVSFLYPSGIAEFAERTGMRLDRFRGIQVSSAHGMRARLIFGIARCLRAFGMAAETMCNNIIYECVKAPASVSSESATPAA